MTFLKLVTWFGALTDQGEALATYLDATGATIPPAPVGSLVSSYAHYFAGLTQDESAALWAEYEGSKVEKSHPDSMGQ